MQTIGRNNDYYVALLDEDDLAIFAAARTACFRDKEDDPEVIDLQKLLETIDHKGSETYWDDYFEPQDRMLHFVLFKDNKGRKPDDVAGMMDIELPKNGSREAYFQTGHVLKAHRGQHLSDLWMQAGITSMLPRVRYDQAAAAIRVNNLRSIKAAERNGFQRIEEYETDLYGSVYYYVLDLKPLRAEAKQALALASPGL